VGKYDRFSREKVLPTCYLSRMRTLLDRDVDIDVYVDIDVDINVDVDVKIDVRHRRRCSHGHRC